MKKRDDLVYLKDILDAIDRIESYVRNVSFQDFGDDDMRQDAIIRQIELIGEAARNVSK